MEHTESQVQEVQLLPDGLLENGTTGKGEHGFWGKFKTCLHCTDASGVEQLALQNLHLGARQRGGQGSRVSGEQSWPPGKGALGKIPASGLCFPVQVKTEAPALLLLNNPWPCSELGWSATPRQNSEVLDS